MATNVTPYATLENSNIKQSFSLYMSRRHIGEVKVQYHSNFTLALDSNEWSATYPGCFISREIGITNRISKINTRIILICGLFNNND
jgi:hypothetical protein